MDTQELQTAIEHKLSSISTEFQKNNADIKAAFEERIKQIETKGVADPELKEKIDRLFTRQDELEAKAGAPDPVQRVAQQKSVGDRFVESKQYQEWKATGFIRNPPKGVTIGDAFGASMLTKAQTRTGDLGSATSGVLSHERMDILDALPQIRLTVRDLLPVRPVASLNVDWLRQATRVNAASPQTEGAAKVESTATWESASVAVRTIAHYFQVATQALADAPWLISEINSELMYGLKLKEETELLTGDGLGSHISGLITNATAYSTALNVSGDTALDKLRHAIYQARLALYPADGIVMHPKDAHNIDLLKEEAGGSNKGSYLVGAPISGMAIKTVWGLPVVECDNMSIGTFLVGAFQKSAILFDRMAAVIDVSYETGSNFVENEATFRCENRVGLGIRRAGGLIYGSF